MQFLILSVTHTKTNWLSVWPNRSTNYLNFLQNFIKNNMYIAGNNNSYSNEAGKSEKGWIEKQIRTSRDPMKNQNKTYMPSPVSTL